MPTLRRSYHTSLKFLARESLIPMKTLALIPRTNLHRWKNEARDKYFTFGVDSGDLKEEELLKTFAKNKIAKRTFAAYVRIIRTVITLAQTLTGFHQLVRRHRTIIVKLIARVRPVTGLKRALRFFDISLPTFRQWSLESMTVCFESLTGYCNRIFPSQLSRAEIVKMKDLLFCARFQYWPVSSIALHALRNNILPLSLNTWYKYVNKLGLSRPRPASRRKKNAISIRASGPNQLWHADITEFTTADQIKHYIYLVVDNFSRKILAWRVADTVSARIRMLSLEDALRNSGIAAGPVTLLTDGGPENAPAVHNLDPVLRSRMVHHIAKVDVLYSNSLIEAHNKILKYNYLYRMEIPDGARLQKLIPEIIDDFNHRPHISLKGLTPEEAIQNHNLDIGKNVRYFHQVRLDRKYYNQNNRCITCQE